MKKLLSSLSLGPFLLRNRVIMAPLTRTRAGERNVPREMNVEYYRQRSSAGLIISEATPVSPYGHGYRGTPGIHTEEQRDGWRPVTSAVHQQGGLIFQQLWHVGRLSHPDLQPGGVLPVAPSRHRLVRGRSDHGRSKAQTRPSGARNEGDPRDCRGVSQGRPACP